MIMDFPSYFRMLAWRFLTVAVWVSARTAPALSLTEADVCVFGGTSGGVAAAVTAARLGRSVVIVEPGRHLGGMTSSGLGVTDIGPHGREYIGGVSREFYRRVGAKYGKAEEVWFEPKVAEQVFDEMVAEAGVAVVFGEGVVAVAKSGGHLTELTTTAGRVVRARMFIDATYEGDLLAAAGASWTMGREPNAMYGESLNGVRTPTPLVAGRRIDPYVVPGDPTSGLIALVRPGPAAAPGTGDALLQAYNFRLCLTNVPANRVPIEPPPGYDPARYELVARYIQSGPAPGKPASRPEAWVLDDLIDVQQLIPNGKTDINAGSPVSTDFHRGNDGYVTATAEQRSAIAREHESYIRGLLHFLRTDPRVPANVRGEMTTWGLAADEFADNGHWPRQLYVREARRMVSDFVMTDRHGRGLESAPEGIGLAAYWLDSHSFQLLEVAGEVRHEGGFFTNSPLYPPRPYPIAFRSIVAKKSEVANLAAPFCLSATHACFASLRMEPVFMITSQAAATAAALALEAGSAIQDVPYERLRAMLMAEGQVISLTPPPQSDGSVMVDTEHGQAVTIVGNWTPSTSVAGYQGTHYLSDGNTGQGTKSVSFQPTLPSSGDYRVAVAYRAFGNRAGSVPVVVTHAAGIASFTLDQRVDAGPWKELGTFSFAAGDVASLTLSNAGADGFVIADAARWVPTPAPPPSPPPIAVMAADPSATEGEAEAGRFVFSRGFKSAAALTVSYVIEGTAAMGEDWAPIGGAVTIPANAVSASIPIRAWPDERLEGEETVVVRLGNSPAFSPVPGFASATVIIRDRPFDAWRAVSFPAELWHDNTVVGPLADPDADGQANAIEWALGSSPTAPNPTALLVAVGDGVMETSVTRQRGVPLDSMTWEISTDAAGWRVPAAPPELIALEERSPSVDRLTWRWAWPTTEGSPAFIRLKISP